jgi:hypothetical protein
MAALCGAQPREPWSKSVPPWPDSRRIPALNLPVLAVVEEADYVAAGFAAAGPASLVETSLFSAGKHQRADKQKRLLGEVFLTSLMPL